MNGERYPDLPSSECLAEHWIDIGLAHPEAMGGATPLKWVEVAAYSELTGSNFSPSEASVIIDMSKAYSAALADKRPLSIEPMERA